MNDFIRLIKDSTLLPFRCVTSLKKYGIVKCFQINACPTEKKPTDISLGNQNKFRLIYFKTGKLDLHFTLPIFGVVDSYFPS